MARDYPLERYRTSIGDFRRGHSTGWQQHGNTIVTPCARRARIGLVLGGLLLASCAPPPAPSPPHSPPPETAC